MTNTELYGQALTAASVDLIVGWTSAGIDPATALASQVGCLPPPQGTESGAHTVEPERDPAINQSVLPTPTRTAGSAASSTQKPANPTPDTSYIGNISGLCDAQLQQLAGQAMTEENAVRTLTTAEPLLAERAVYLPLFQDTIFVGVTGDVDGVPLSGPVQVAIFGDAARWRQS